jgi:hypothetical protein
MLDEIAQQLENLPITAATTPLPIGSRLGSRSGATHALFGQSDHFQAGTGRMSIGQSREGAWAGRGRARAGAQEGEGDGDDGDLFGEIEMQVFVWARVCVALAVLMKQRKALLREMFMYACAVCMCVCVCCLLHAYISAFSA